MFVNILGFLRFIKHRNCEMKHRELNFLFSGVLFILVGLALPGCAYPEEGIIKGNITFKGSPVTNGDVCLQNVSKGIGLMIPITLEGKFQSITAVPIGEYEISVTPAMGPPPDINGKAKAPMQKSFLPEKYKSFSTSGLSITVAKGLNEVSLKLE
ncbi:MAG: hypothetical protein EXS07_13165 [Gemmataceae bacterium]|nr:hypothetical protein [Gemmataceae bacterium]